MAGEGVNFDPESASRIGSVVRTVEASPLGISMQKRRRHSGGRGKDTPEMYDVSIVKGSGGDPDTWNIRPGTWITNGGVAWTTIASSSTLPTTAAQAIPVGAYAGQFLIYALLQHSWPLDDQAAIMDFDEETGATWTTTSSDNAVVIVVREGGVPLVNQDPFNQWQPIATVLVDIDGKITNISQHHRGEIIGDNNSGIMGGSKSGVTPQLHPIYSITFHYTLSSACFVSAFASPFVTVTFNASNPEIGRNNRWVNLAEHTYNTTDFASGDNYVYLALIDPATNSWVLDPSISIDLDSSLNWAVYKTTAALVHQGMSNWFRAIYTANLSASDADVFTPMTWMQLNFYPNNARLTNL